MWPWTESKKVQKTFFILASHANSSIWLLQSLKYYFMIGRSGKCNKRSRLKKRQDRRIWEEKRWKPVNSPSSPSADARWSSVWQQLVSLEELPLPVSALSARLHSHSYHHFVTCLMLFSKRITAESCRKFSLLHTIIYCGQKFFFRWFYLLRPQWTSVNCIFLQWTLRGSCWVSCAWSCWLYNTVSLSSGNNPPVSGTVSTSAVSLM